MLGRAQMLHAAGYSTLLIDFQATGESPGRIGLLRCPVLIIGGTVDQQTTVDDTQQLFEAASEPKELWLVRGAGHVDYLAVASSEYRRRVLEFFDRNLRTRTIG